MALVPHNIHIFITFLFLSMSTPLISSAPCSSSSCSLKSYKNFIKTSCNSTTYPTLCYKTLTPYTSFIKRNPLTLCNSALAVSIKAARATSAMVTKLARQKGITKIEAAIVKDCIENAEDAVYELRQSLKAMSKLKGEDREVQMANAKTWVSAAITDEDTCMDGFVDRKVSASVKKKIRDGVVGVMRISSVALSLINSLDY